MPFDNSKYKEFKEYFKKKHHADLKDFLMTWVFGDDAQCEAGWKKYWNDGSLGDNEKTPLVLCGKSDEIWYCWNNGYVNTSGLNKKFHDLDEADQVRFVEDYCEYCRLQG
jgi:hypothetical protein